MKARLKPYWDAFWRLPVEVAPAAALGIVGVFTHGWIRTACWSVAGLLTLLLFRSDTGLRLLAAGSSSAWFVAAIYWESQDPAVRIELASAGTAWIWLVRRLGAVAWPDVAVVLVCTLAVIAVRDLANEPPKPDPPPLLPPPVAVFELPGERVRPPDVELAAPARVELIALTPRRTPRTAQVTHDARRFQALLLTSLQPKRPVPAVRLVVERGAEGASSSDLARVRLDATEFVVVPARDCFLAPPRPGVSQLRAQAVLEGYGIPEELARSYVDSFTGRIDFVQLRPGRAVFWRYFSRGKIGRFLTQVTFPTQDDAQEGLDLPEDNLAEQVQRVRVSAPTMALYGRIRDGAARARQWIVLRTGCFDYGSGQPLPERAG